MISTNDIKRLRDKTGAGVLDCREALQRCGGDFGGAMEVLRAKGAEMMEKRADREAVHGYVATYGHHGRVGVIVELRCETDFVSSNPGFRDLAHEIALQVAATSPRWVSREDVPTEVIGQLVAEERANATRAEKPERVVEQIVRGKVERFCRDNCLLDQVSIRDDKSTVNGLIHDKVVAFGERIQVRRFARFSLDT
jgi:elongation factor Ts